MQTKKNKIDAITNKLIKGINIGRKSMLEEKSMRGEFVIYYEGGKIKRESAREILKREKVVKAK